MSAQSNVLRFPSLCERMGWPEFEPIKPVEFSSAKWVESNLHHARLALGLLTKTPDELHTIATNWPTEELDGATLRGLIEDLFSVAGAFDAGKEVCETAAYRLAIVAGYLDYLEGGAS